MPNTKTSLSRTLRFALGAIALLGAAALAPHPASAVATNTTGFVRELRVASVPSEHILVRLEDGSGTRIALGCGATDDSYATFSGAAEQRQQYQTILTAALLAGRQVELRTDVVGGTCQIQRVTLRSGS